jgi:hypothetical protein
MEKLLKILKALGVDVASDDIKAKLEADDFKKVFTDNWPKEVDTKDLFTQEQVNEIVSKRLTREQKVHEAEIGELQEKMKGLLDPSKVKEFEGKIEELEKASKANQAKLTKEYELKLAATKAGVKDPDYFDFLAQKDSLYDRIKVNEDGSLVATDKDGNILVEDGKKFGPEKLVEELKESKPDLFGEVRGQQQQQQQTPWGPGPTNPAGGKNTPEEGSFGKEMAKSAQSEKSAIDHQKNYFGE